MAAVVAVFWFVTRRKTPLDKHFEEQRNLQANGDVAISKGVEATPILSTRGEEPLTTFIAAPTLAKLDQATKGTQWFPRFGEILN